MGRIISQRGQVRPSPDAGARRGPDPTGMQVLPAPQFGNPSDSGKLPVERFPTAPVGLRRGSLGAGQAVINSGVELPLISAEPGTGPRPELAVALVLHRVHGGGVVKLDEDYWDRESPATGRRAGAFDELTAGKLLVLADPDSHGLRRVTLTTAGQARHEQLRGSLRPPALPVPAPEFPAIKTLARERLSGSGPLAPAEQPGSPGGSIAGPLRWARCPADGRLHLLVPDVVVATTGRHAEALCGRALPADGLALTRGSSGALCMVCVNRIPSDPGPRGTP